MAEYIVIFIFAVISGIAQGVCGFGAGVIMMIILPYFFSISQSAGIAGLISMALIVLMVIRYRKHIRMKNVIPPVILYAAVSATAIYFSPMVDQVLLKRLFGAFLILITLYHFFLDKKSSVKKWPVPVSIAAIIFSGACSGLFSVGGPLMVIYYMAHTDSKEEFLGTTEMLFMHPGPIPSIRSAICRSAGCTICRRALCAVCRGTARLCQSRRARRR